MSRLFSAVRAAGVVFATALTSAAPLAAQESPTASLEPPGEISSEYLGRLATDLPSRSPGSLALLNYMVVGGCRKVRRFETLGDLVGWEARLNGELERGLSSLISAHETWKDRVQTYGVVGASGAKQQYARRAQKVAATVYVFKPLSECIRQREQQLINLGMGELGAGDRKLQATWVAGRCENVPDDIHPDKTGGITMILHADGSVEGAFYSFEGAGDLDVAGTLGNGGVLEAFGPAKPSSVFARVEGTVAPPAPGETAVTGSGVIRFGGTWLGSSWRCHGTWSSD